MINTQELPKPTKEKVLTWEEIREMRIQAFDTFFEAFKPALNAIYYPGSNKDFSPSKTKGFQGKRIIYVDMDTKAIETLQGMGFDAHVSDAEAFDPGKVDLLLLFNFYADKPLEHVVKNGYVICNQHWQEQAFTKILKKNDFEFVGALVETNGIVRLDRENLQNYSLAPDLNKGKSANLFVFRKQ